MLRGCASNNKLLTDLLRSGLAGSGLNRMINLHLCIELLQIRPMCENVNLRVFIFNIYSFNPVAYVRCENIFYLKKLKQISNHTTVR